MTFPSPATPDIRYSMGESADLEAIRRLLATNGLPHQDIDLHVEHFLLAWREEALIAVAGLELCGANGLLRSVCVAQPCRRTGLASRMCRELEAYARNLGVKRLYLLTASAQDFFARLGYSSCARGAVPPEVAKTPEFRALCPSTAVCMVRNPEGGALYLPRHLLPLRRDVPGARMWAASLSKTMLTYFEVEPHTRFDAHSHEAEQITSVVEGELFFEFEEGVVRVGAGEVMAIPSGVSHAVYTQGRKAAAFDAWSPPPPKYRRDAAPPDS